MYPCTKDILIKIAIFVVTSVLDYKKWHKIWQRGENDHSCWYITILFKSEICTWVLLQRDVCLVEQFAHARPSLRVVLFGALQIVIFIHGYHILRKKFLCFFSVASIKDNLLIISEWKCFLKCMPVLYHSKSKRSHKILKSKHISLKNEKI